MKHLLLGDPKAMAPGWLRKVRRRDATRIFLTHDVTRILKPSMFYVCVFYRVRPMRRKNVATLWF